MDKDKIRELLLRMIGYCEDQHFTSGEEVLNDLKWQDFQDCKTAVQTMFED